jgi:hypothetical protein
VDPYDTDQTDSPTADDVLPPRDVVKKWEQALLKKTMGYNQICIWQPSPLLWTKVSLPPWTPPRHTQQGKENFTGYYLRTQEG